MLEAGGNPGSSLLRPQQARMQRNPGHGSAIRCASCGLRTQSSVTPAAAGIQPSSPTDQYGSRDWVPAAVGTTGGFGTQHFDPVISNPASSGEKSASIHGFRSTSIRKLIAPASDPSLTPHPAELGARTQRDEILGLAIHTTTLHALRYREDLMADWELAVRRQSPMALPKRKTESERDR